MKSRNIYFILFVGIMVLLGGCRTAPVKNVDNAAITVSGKYSETDVKKAIITAGRQLGWIMKEVEPGLLEGKLLLRTHVAIVDIPYNKSSYSIKYKSSENLQYSKSDNTIHSNYNGWITNLNNGIQVQLNALEM